MASKGFRAKEMAWLEAHDGLLRTMEPGSWIGIDGEGFIASAPTLEIMLWLCDLAGISDPFITAIPRYIGGGIFVLEVE